MLELTESNFAAETRNAVVIVDFWAEWCGPCKMLAPVFDEVAGKMGSKVKFAKVNIDTSAELAQKNEIRSIPCIVVYKNGSETARFTGYLSESELKENIERALK
jgi:thioredoxin 1